MISLSDRSRLAKSLNADVFVSLHCNASKTVAKGIEVYAHDSDNQYTKQSIALGFFVLDKSIQKLGFKKRGVKYANFQVLRETRTLCPAILVETGFLTDSDEADYLSAKNNRCALALAILMGITKYLDQ